MKQYVYCGSSDSRVFVGGLGMHCFGDASVPLKRPVPPDHPEGQQGWTNTYDWGEAGRYITWRWLAEALLRHHAENTGAPYELLWGVLASCTCEYNFLCHCTPYPIERWISELDKQWSFTSGWLQYRYEQELQRRLVGSAG